MSATDSDRARDAYFQAIETTFIRLRGAPLLLSPADWQTARAWFREGIPLDVVCGVLESVFAGFREHTPERRISSLRYCAPAVEEAWREIQDLSAVEHRLEPKRVDVEERLAQLAASLPADLPSCAEIRGELGRIEGSAEAVEGRLQELDVRMLEAADGSLDTTTRQQIRERAHAALQRALEGFGPGRRDPDLEDRLYRQFLRRQLGLPILSLFSGSVESPSG